MWSHGFRFVSMKLKPPAALSSATTRCFSSAIYGSSVCFCRCCITVAAVLFCFLPLGHVPSRLLLVAIARYFPVSLNHIVCSYAVAQRRVVIAACGVFEALISTSHCCFFVFSPPPPSPLSAPLSSYSHSSALYGHSGPSSHSRSFALLTPPHPPLPLCPAFLHGPRMSDAAQSAPR